MAGDSALSTTSQAYFDEYSSNRHDELQSHLDSLLKLFKCCESPLEQVFLVKFVEDLQAVPIFVDDLHFMGYPKPGPFSERFRARIYPQRTLEIQGSRYRADFLITLERDEWESGPYPDPTLHCQIVVEVDGHEFHERTKEQAQKDKSRDRQMQQVGYMVFRYTGSEIYNDVASSVSEVMQCLWDKIDQVIKEKGP
jgi:hypothetical protein